MTRTSVALIFAALAATAPFAQGPASPPQPEKAQYIYVLRPVERLQTEANWTERDSAVAQRHFAHLKELNAKGIVIHAGRTAVLDAKTFGLVIFDAPSAEEAKRVMESDPAVKDGIMTAEVFPYRIVFGRTEP